MRSSDRSPGGGQSIILFQVAEDITSPINYKVMMYVYSVHAKKERRRGAVRHLQTENLLELLLRVLREDKRALPQPYLQDWRQRSEVRSESQGELHG